MARQYELQAIALPQGLPYPFFILYLRWLRKHSPAMNKTIFLILLIGTLVFGCNGSSPDTNHSAPIFTSADIDTFTENTTLVAHTASATDADGGRLAWTLSDGPDSALFSIESATGELRFKNPPDYESPQDENRDNNYELAISVSDGLHSESQPLVIQVLDGDDADLVANKTVAMRSISATNPAERWVFEPDYIKLEPGDVLEFTTIDTAHNSVSEATPNDAAGWQTLFTGGKIKLQQQGIYIYYCDPHRNLGMWGVIQVGDASINKAAAIAKVEEIVEFMTKPRADRLRAAIAKVE